MPSTTLSPQPHLNNNSRSMSGKRKRDAVDGEAETNPTLTNGVSEAPSRLQEWFKDALQILQRYDDNLSLFDRPLPPTSPAKPSPKRSKTVESPTKPSISSKITQNAYASFEELLKDLDHVGQSRTQELDHDLENGEVSAATIEEEKERIATVKKRFQALVAGEMFLRPSLLEQEGDTKKSEDRTNDRGHVSSQNGTILTVFGGDRVPRQLFSSRATSDGKDISEVPLPNGISTTDVIPAHSLGEKEKAPTIGQSFPPHSSVKPIAPPKHSSRHTATRSTSVNWYNPADSLPSQKESSSRDPYFKQSLPVGRWLSYNVAPSTESMTSPGSRRRHRDRALSTGEPQSAIDAETTAAHAQARDDALFRSVFSSFAPSRDDYGAIVPQEQRNRLWWNRLGEARFHEALDHKDEEISAQEEPDVAVEAEEVDDKLLEEGIDTCDFTFEADNATKSAISDNEHGTDALLEEISELLEILNSHHRIRSLSQSSTTRPLQGAPIEHFNTIPSDYSSPSAAEIQVYNSLEAQLTEVISSLPPYVLSKLDSEKLGVLTINTKIKLPGKYHRGNLQEDPLSSKPRPPANPYPYTATNTNIRSGYSTTPNQQFSQRNNYSSTPAQRPAAPQNSFNYSTGRPPGQYTGGGSGTTRQNYSQPYQPQRSNSSYVDRFASGQLGPQQSPLSFSRYPNQYRTPSGPQGNAYPQQQPQYNTPGTTNRVSTPVGQYQPSPGPRPGSGYTYTPAQGNSLFGSSGQGQQRPGLYQQHSSHYGGSKSPQPNGVGMTPPRKSVGVEGAGSPG